MSIITMLFAGNTALFALLGLLAAFYVAWDCESCESHPVAWCAAAFAVIFLGLTYATIGVRASGGNLLLCLIAIGASMVGIVGAGCVLEVRDWIEGKLEARRLHLEGRIYSYRLLAAGYRDLERQVQTGQCLGKVQWRLRLLRNCRSMMDERQINDRLAVRLITGAVQSEGEVRC